MLANKADILPGDVVAPLSDVAVKYVECWTVDVSPEPVDVEILTAEVNVVVEEEIGGKVIVEVVVIIVSDPRKNTTENCI